MVDNIIQFPVSKKYDDEDSNTPESVEVSYNVTQTAVYELLKSGCKFDDMKEDMLPHLIMIFESIHSLYLLSKEQPHPMQVVAKELYSFHEDG